MHELKVKKIKLQKDKLVFRGYDGWGRPTYVYNDIYYLKDVSLKGDSKHIPNILYDTADYDFDGEPNNAFEIILI